MGTAPQRERSDTPFAGELKDGHGTTARAIRHARSPQRVHRSSSQFRHGTTARAIRHARSPQRVRIVQVRSFGTAPQRERFDTPDPRRGCIVQFAVSHGTTARAIRHARSPQRVHRARVRRSYPRLRNN